MNSNQPKPAPTAEEQPLETTEEEERAARLYAHGMQYYPFTEKHTIARLKAQLLAALRSNREKDASYQTLNNVVIAKCVQVKELFADLAEKNAKNAELEDVWNCAMSQSVGLRYDYEGNFFVNERAETAEAQLRAVSQVLKTLELAVDGGFEPLILAAAERAAPDIRSIVDGKN